MPWTIYAYILKELSRLLVVATAVLVLVISFAAAVKPLSDGLLSSWTLIKFVLYSIPTTLMLVMPFAGAFASTLVFSRMASDNEIVACAVGGVSYRTLLLPVFMLGWALAVVLYLLSNWVVPWYVLQSSQMLQQDLASVVLRQVEQSRPVEIPGSSGYVLYADNAEAVEMGDAAAETPADGVAPHKMIKLAGFVVGRFDQQGKLRDLYAAERVDVYLYRYRNRTWVQLPLQKVMLYDPITGSFYEADKTRVLPFEVVSPLGDDPRHLSWPQLIHLSEDPQRYDRVARAKQRLAMRIAQERLLRKMQSVLAESGGQVTLWGISESMRCVIGAPHVERAKSSVELYGGASVAVTVRVYEHGLHTFDLEARSAAIKVEVDDPGQEPFLDLLLESVTVTDMRIDGPPVFKRDRPFHRLRWPTPVLESLLSLSPGELQMLAARELPDAAGVRMASNRLRKNIDKLRRKIFAQVHQRGALSVSTMLVLMLGAVLSMKLRGTMPLVVYFCSFLLAALAVFVTGSGENVASDPEYSPGVGLLVVWIGNIALAMALGGVYRKLARH